MSIDPGASDWYEFIYPQLSSIAHGAEALSHLIPDDANGAITPNYLSSEKEVCKVLMASTRLLLHCASKSQEYIGFGSDVRAEVDDFQKECETIDAINTC